MKVNITKKGAILLGKYVSCDGFVDNKGFRVQTHVHEDHLSRFSTSLGYQKGVLLTNPTLDLIAAIKNEQALVHRSDIYIVKGNELKKFENIEIEFLDSNHMLGSVQVAVNYYSAPRCGYSGDFSWPLDKVIQVEELVLDSTYGQPESVRSFSQEKVEERLLELIVEQLNNNPILIISRRGTIQRAMHCINCNIKVPFIVSKKLSREIEIYNKYGYNFNDCYNPSSPKGQDILDSNRYIRYYGTGDLLPCDTSGFSVINLKGTFGRQLEPVVDHGNNIFTISYSDHADFNETIEYVRASNAKRVITDPTRSNFKNASILASEIKKRLKIETAPCRTTSSNYWGE